VNLNFTQNGVYSQAQNYQGYEIDEY